MAMCTLMIEKARNYTRPNGCRQSWTGSLVRDRAAANPRSYSEPTIQQERIRGKENDLMKKSLQAILICRVNWKDPHCRISVGTLPWRDQVRTLFGKKCFTYYRKCCCYPLSSFLPMCSFSCNILRLGSAIHTFNHIYVYATVLRLAQERASDV